jgi:hypothetical protein
MECRKFRRGVGKRQKKSAPYVRSETENVMHTRIMLKVFEASNLRMDTICV